MSKAPLKHFFPLMCVCIIT